MNTTQASPPSQQEANEKCCVGREKYWEELSIEEKIERIRQVIKSTVLPLQEEVIKLQTKLGQLGYTIKNHEHLSGKVYVLAELNGNHSLIATEDRVGGRRISKPDDKQVYF